MEIDYDILIDLAGMDGLYVFYIELLAYEFYRCYTLLSSGELTPEERCKALKVIENPSILYLLSGL